MAERKQHEEREERAEHEEREEQGQRSGTGAGRAREKSHAGPTSEEEDLKKREYRDKEGNIHHHTHTSEEYKREEAKKKK